LDAFAEEERHAVVLPELARIVDVEQRRALLRIDEPLEQRHVDLALGALQDPCAHPQASLLARPVAAEEVGGKGAVECAIDGFRSCGLREGPAAAAERHDGAGRVAPPGTAGAHAPVPAQLADAASARAVAAR